MSFWLSDYQHPAFQLWQYYIFKNSFKIKKDKKLIQVIKFINQKSHNIIKKPTADAAIDNPIMK